MAQGRLAKDQKKDQRNGEKQPEHAQQDSYEEAEQEADHRHEKGNYGGDVHELVLQMVARKELSKSGLDATGRLPAACGFARFARGRILGPTAAHSYRRGLTARRIGLWLAAEAAEPGPFLDLFPAFATEQMYPLIGSFTGPRAHYTEDPSSPTARNQTRPGAV